MLRLFNRTKSTKGVKPTFEIFDESYGYISSRTASNPDPNADYLWTNDLTACVAIGLHADKRITLYHSVGEHRDLDVKSALNSSSNNNNHNKNLIETIYQFLANISDTKNLKIFIGHNPTHTPNINRDLVYIIAIVNKCIDEINNRVRKNKPPLHFIKNKSIENYEDYQDLSDLPDKEKEEISFTIIESIGGTFYLTANENAEVGSAEVALEKAILSIKDLLLTHANDSKCVKSLLSILPSFEATSESPITNYVLYKETLEKIKAIASDFLCAKKISDQEEIKLLQKIVAWDVFLNEPTRRLYDNWAQQVGYNTKAAPGFERK